MSTYANRGMGFEELVGTSNILLEKYKIAKVIKIPTSVAILKVTKGGLVSGYLEEKGTVDFQGLANVDGRVIPVYFDAKETQSKNLPFANVHQHQVDFLRTMKSLGAESFLLIRFSSLNRYFRLDIDVFCKYVANPEKNRKSIPLQYIEDNGVEVFEHRKLLLDYLKGI